METYTKEQLEGKFVIVYDTMVDGNQCATKGDEGSPEYGPVLYNSADEAFAEIFDDNHSMLTSHMEDRMLGECNPGVTKKLIAEMGKILESKDVSAMRKFMDKHPQCDDTGEWVEPANEFTLNRKFIIGERNGELVSTIQGEKLATD
jgi:hypothetical protein